MNFAQHLRNEAAGTLTENGATAINTTGDALLDMFGVAGSLRTADENRIETLFVEAIKEDPVLAAKLMFYIRDVRGGLGERRTFRILLRYAAKYHPELVRPNIKYVGLYGRYDDLYWLMDTPLESEMWSEVMRLLNADIVAMREGEPVTLLAKWLKTADASSPKTRALGIKTAQNLGMSVYDYKRTLRALRKYIRVTEVSMSANEWDRIDYETVPSRAMMNYHKAFSRHDPDGFQRYISNVHKGDQKINASTLFPYDIIEKYTSSDGWWGFKFKSETDQTLEAQWKALPDYVGRSVNAMVIADTSGSMYGRPICSAIGLAIYFAQRNTGAFHNLWMSFSGESTVHELHGETLSQQLGSINTSDWGSNTNLERAFMKILAIAVNSQTRPEDMVKSLIVISDMEIDHCAGSWLFYDEMKKRYASYGYDIPNVVFWNVDSRQNVFHADKKRKGVQLCSGQSASTFKTLMQSIGMTPMEMMLSVLNSARYYGISVER